MRGLLLMCVIFQTVERYPRGSHKTSYQCNRRGRNDRCYRGLYKEAAFTCGGGESL